MGAAVRVPRIWSLNLISVIFCEAVALYGVIIAIILSQKVRSVPMDPVTMRYCPFAYSSGYASFASGYTVGLGNLICGCVAAPPRPTAHGARRARRPDAAAPDPADTAASASAPSAARARSPTRRTGSSS